MDIVIKFHEMTTKAIIVADEEEEDRKWSP